MKMISQRENSDCGVACLSMILDNFGIKSSYTKVAEHIRADKNGSSIYGICKASEAYNIKATALSGTAEEFRKAASEKEFHFPVIARIVNANGMSHFIVVKSVRHNRINVLDPDMNTGKRTYNFDFFSKIFLHEIIAFEKTEAFSAQKSVAVKSPLVKYMRSIINGKSLFYMALLMVMSVIVTGIGLTSSMLIKYITDNVFKSAGGTEESIEMLAVLITVMLILYLTRFGIQFFRGKISLKLASKLNKDVIHGVYNKLLSLPVSFFARKETADIMQRFSAADEIVQASTSIIMTCTLDILMVIISGTAIYLLSPELFTICAVMLVLYIAVPLMFSKTIEKSNREMTYTGVKLNNCIKETTEGMTTIKALNGENTMSEKFEAHYSAFRNAVIKAGMQNVSKSALLELIEGIGILVVFWVASVNIADNIFSLGSLMAVYSMLGYFLTPAENIINIQSEIVSANIAAERLEEISDSAPETSATESGNVISTGKIEFEDVTFRYGYNPPVISNASFTVKSGTNNCITGASGSGKTTISKLIAGFYKPESGSISISGKNINEYNIKELRKSVCYLPQSTFLFAGTIRDNLVFANDRDISDEEINKVLSLCGADFVAETGGLYTVIQENAENLSGGQKQKLALARAILRDSSILILDEITANIDIDSKKKIIEAVCNLENITKIWISHDSDVIDSCDNIFRLNNNGTVSAV